MVVDKGSFFKVFLDNIEKVISKDTIGAGISKTSNEITQLERDLSELVQLKIRKQIDDKYYNKEYARIMRKNEEYCAKFLYSLVKVKSNK